MTARIQVSNGENAQAWVGSSICCLPPSPKGKAYGNVEVSIGGLSSHTGLLSSLPLSQACCLQLLARRTSKATTLLGLCRQGTVPPRLTPRGQSSCVFDATCPGQAVTHGGVSSCPQKPSAGPRQL